MGTVSLLGSNWETKWEAGGYCASAPFPACRLGTWDITWELPTRCSTRCCAAFSSSVVLQLPKGVEQEQLLAELHCAGDGFAPGCPWNPLAPGTCSDWHWQGSLKKKKKWADARPLAACITATWITQVSLRPLWCSWCLWHLRFFTPSKLTQNQSKPSIKPGRFMIRRRLVHFPLSERNRHINIFCADSFPCGNSPGGQA